MQIIKDRIEDKEKLKNLEDETFYDDMIKCVVDIERELVAINADLHSDLEQLLLDDGSDQHNLYGINILYDYWEIEYDSLINPPRNREAGYPRVGRYVADPEVRKKIEEIVNKWIVI